MAIECPPCPKCPPPGLPAWMGTFADLMSLLMCFFVLLLAFSEMDVLKFKQIAGSMKYAFGVQNKLEVKDIPKGTSVIATEFRPGRPEPTPIETIQQQTIELKEPILEYQSGEEDAAGGRQKQRGNQRGGSAKDVASQTSASEKSTSDQDENNVLIKKVMIELEQKITDGAIEIEQLGQEIKIRVNDKGSFISGSASLQNSIKPTIAKIAELLSKEFGDISVSGHTDNRRISSERYQSNWDLSTQRAIAIAEEMLKNPTLDKEKFRVVGHAATMPLAPNNSAANRTRNRRVEISLIRGKPKQSDPLRLTQ